MKKLICAVTVLTVLTVSTAQAGVVIHVDVGNCPGPGDGSVGDPYCSIQTAIDNAVDTDEIVVAEGIYLETIDFIGKAITVRSTDPTDPMVVVNTVIDGTGTNSSVVLCFNGEGLGTVLSGFVVTGGNNIFGGGMLNNGSSPTVTNCTFSGNSADVSGGGMLNFNSSSPMVTNCTFSGNSAGFEGGGMLNDSSSPTVTNCTFCNNDPDQIEGDPIVDGGGNNFVCVVGACCLNDSCIVVLLEDNCITAGGTYQGGNTICGASSCPDPCRADIDGDGNVGINDFLDLLAAWGPCQ